MKLYFQSRSIHLSKINQNHLHVLYVVEANAPMQSVICRRLVMAEHVEPNISKLDFSIPVCYSKSLKGFKMLRHAGPRTFSNSKPLYMHSRHISDAFYPKVGRRTFSQTAARNSYADTIKNLLIHKDTRVLCQGLTGKTVQRSE